MACKQLPTRYTVSLAAVRQALAMRKHGWCANFSSYSCSIGYADVLMQHRVRRHSVPGAGPGMR